MKTVGFITRDLSGTTRQSTFSEGSPSLLNVTHSKDISLNLSASDIDSYMRRGSDLHLVLADGQILVLQNYYSQNTPGGKNLFLSEEGNFVEVVLEDKAEGALFASYEPLDLSGKWSAYDDMVFLNVDRIEPVIAPLAAPLFGGFGAAGAAAGAAGVAVLAGGGGGGGNNGGGGGGGGGGGPILPTVDNPDATYPVAGSTTAPIVITGTGTPGAEVEVDLGGVTQTGTIQDDGTWEVTFPVGDLPVDGSYDTTVQVSDPDGTEHDLDGPAVVIDTTPPDLEVTSGTDSTGDLVNAATHASGTVIAGTGEAGASVSVLVNGATQTTTVGSDGTWSVTFAPGEISTGEYDTPVSITTTDSFGNSATFSDTLIVDTIAPPIAVNTVETDDVINQAEASDGVILSGNGEAGAAIEVLFQGVIQTTTVAADGTWSVSYDASQIAGGTYDSTATVTSTDLAGNSATSDHSLHVDTETSVILNSSHAGGDDAVSGAEAQAGVTLTGLAEAGASVVVEIAGVSRIVTADSAGNWEATFAPGALLGGEYNTVVNVTSTDLAGNSATTSSPLRIDTVAGTVALSPDPIEIDDVINAVERADGVEISGTATPGMTVTVGLGSATTQVMSDVDGNWSTIFPVGSIPQGTETLDITASITDDLGNTASASDTVALDTLVTPLTLNTNGIAGDNTINATERADGVTLTGTVEPGSSVQVAIGTGAAQNAIVDTAGNWSVTVPTNAIPTGTTDVDVVVQATDTAGNTGSVVHSVAIDTEVTPFTSDANQTANDVVNQDELNAGFALQGTVEPGSSVVVTIQGKAKSATVDAAGNWSAEFSGADLPPGEYSADATIVATDAAGNTSTLTESFEVDTIFEAPLLDSITYEIGSSDISAFSVEGTAATGETIAVNALEGDGSVSSPGVVITESGGNTSFDFNNAIPDGTDLVVTNVDTLGNGSSTLLVLEDNATTASTLTHAGLGQFNIDELDLGAAANVSLVLTEADIKALSENSDTLTIHSGSTPGEDSVTMTGATLAGTRNVDGEMYNVYTIGDDGTTLVIDQDVSVII
ncbi:beta strand repeat-containing protein [Pseudophaeobacter profundi]|uniref:beta strand repeat-containing protein n=1 Tax=Pseudophaeobacter profundi TaxID=3034152 RepID=UPI0024324A95|nr:Ig-like domain-containing protein [Pseudophaeobacter profundi]